MRYLFVLCFLSVTQAAEFANTDIVLLRWAGKLAQPKVVSLRRLTAHKSYDNQPFFSMQANGLYFTSASDEGQRGIYFYSLTSRQEKLVWSSMDDAWLPHENINGDIAFVRGEARQLWLMSAGNKEAHRVFPDVSAIAGFGELSPNQWAFIVSGEPSHLDIIAAPNSPIAALPQTIATHVGCCLEVQTNGALRYVQMIDGSHAQIMEWLDDSSHKLVDVLPEADDFISLSDGSIVMARRAILYRRSGEDKEWRPWLDLRAFGLDHISHLAKNQDGTAIALTVAE